MTERAPGNSRNWGGRREGAGRKRKSAGAVPHAARPRHARHYPLHVTWRVRRGIPSLRHARLIQRLRAAFATARERFGFRLAHYSVQGNHLHLIVEAYDGRALSRGLQGLGIRIAKAVNRVHDRRGPVLAQRYYARPLTNALHVRRALVYVLFNERHHLAQRGLSLPPWWLDACSSAHEFTGFKQHPELPPVPLKAHETTVPPRSFLLRTGWQRLGHIGIEEEPAPSRRGWVAAP